MYSSVTKKKNSPLEKAYFIICLSSNLVAVPFRVLKILYLQIDIVNVAIFFTAFQYMFKHDSS